MIRIELINSHLREVKLMDMVTYYDQLKKTALECFKRLNKTTQLENKNFKFPAGRLEISVVRGKLLEKAATSRIRLRKKIQPLERRPSLMSFRSKPIPLPPRFPSSSLTRKIGRQRKTDLEASWM